MAYIDQKAAVDAVKKVIGNLDHECKPMMDFYSALWNVPAADVAPVVRCRECKYYTPQKKSKQWDCKTLYCNRVVTVKTKPDDFCSYGDRR